MRTYAATAAIALSFFNSASLAAEELTLAAALQRARERAPQLLIESHRVNEARARLAGASRRFTENPEVEVATGQRSAPEGSSTDFEIAAHQNIDLPQRRTQRINAANAAVDEANQLRNVVIRDLLRDVAVAYTDAAIAQRRIGTTTQNSQLAQQTLTVAERRYKAGDIAQLDLNVARTALVRANAERRLAEAEARSATGTLRRLFAMSDAEPITFSTASALPVPITVQSDALAARPELLALDAAIAQAQAELRLAETLRLPEFGVGAQHVREGEETAILGSLRVTLPVFQRGQEAAAVATARLNRLRIERQSLMQSLETQLATSVAAYDVLRQAVIEFESVALPLLEENERLALESYDVGQIGLGDLIQVRRDAVETREAYLAALASAHRAHIDVQAQIGALQ